MTTLVDLVQDAVLRQDMDWLVNPVPPGKPAPPEPPLPVPIIPGVGGSVVLLCDECARSVPLLQTANCCGMRMCTECEDQHPDCAEALRAYES